MKPFIKALEEERKLINEIDYLKMITTEHDLTVEERGRLLTSIDNKKRELRKTQLEIGGRIQYYLDLQ